jgi:hypothetical protein
MDRNDACRGLRTRHAGFVDRLIQKRPVRDRAASHPHSVIQITYPKARIVHSERWVEHPTSRP